MSTVDGDFDSDAWCFSTGDGQSALYLWFADLYEVDGAIQADLNVGDLIKQCRKCSNRVVVMARASGLRSLLIRAHEKSEKVRVVILDKGRRTAPYGNPSDATMKSRDSRMWSVEHLGGNAGRFQLRREQDSSLAIILSWARKRWIKYVDEVAGKESFLAAIAPRIVARRSFAVVVAALLTALGAVWWLGGALDRKKNLQEAISAPPRSAPLVSYSPIVLSLSPVLRAEDVSGAMAQAGVRSTSAGDRAHEAQRVSTADLPDLYKRVQSGEVVANTYRVQIAVRHAAAGNYEESANQLRHVIDGRDYTAEDLGLYFKVRRLSGQPLRDFALADELLSYRNECNAKLRNDLGFDCRAETYAVLVKQLEQALDFGLHFDAVVRLGLLQKLPNEYRVLGNYVDISDRRSVAALRVKELALGYVATFDSTLELDVADRYLRENLRSWEPDEATGEDPLGRVFAIVAAYRELLNRRYIGSIELPDLLASTFLPLARQYESSLKSGVSVPAPIALAAADIALVVLDLNAGAIEASSREFTTAYGDLGAVLRRTLDGYADSPASAEPGSAEVSVLVNLARSAIFFSDEKFVPALRLASAARDQSPLGSAVWWQGTATMYKAAMSGSLPDCNHPLPISTGYVSAPENTARFANIICLAKECRLDEARDNAVSLNAFFPRLGNRIEGAVRAREKVVATQAALELATGRLVEARRSYRSAIELWSVGARNRTELASLGRGWWITEGALGEHAVQKALEGAFILSLHGKSFVRDMGIYGPSPFRTPPTLCNATDIRDGAIRLNTHSTGVAKSDFGDECPDDYGGFNDGRLGIWSDGTRYFLVDSTVPGFWVPWLRRTIQGDFATIRKALSCTSVELN